MHYMLDLITIIGVLVVAAIGIGILEWRMNFFSNLFREMMERSSPDSASSRAADPDTPEREDVRGEVEQEFWLSFDRQIASAERRGDNEEAQRLRRAYESHEEAWRAQRALRSRAPSSQDAASPTALQAHLRGDVRALLERSDLLETFSSDDWVIRANGYLAVGEPDRAAGAYRQALRGTPNDPQLELLYAVALQRSGQLRESLRIYDGLLSADGAPTPPLLVGRGKVLAELERYDDAIRDFDAALNITGEDGDTLYERSRALADADRLDEAIAGFQAARTHMSNNPDLHNELGNALALAGRNQEALQAYDSAISLRPAFARAYYNRGATYSRMGQFEEAAEAFERCLRLRLDIPEAHYAYGLALARLERFRDAAVAFERAVVLRPSFADALFRKARAQSRLGQTSEAFDALRQAVATAPALRLQARTEADFTPLFEDPDIASRFEELIA